MVDSCAPISVVVVDDEPLARSLIATLVRRDSELMLVGECENGASALEKVQSVQPDLLFLDIKMPLMDGVTLAERLTREEHSPYIIFVTAFDDYAIEAFELDALDYLVKPVEKARFCAAVDRAKNAIRDQEIIALTQRLMSLNKTDHHSPDLGHEILVRRGEEVVQLSTRDIQWLEAANQYVHIHSNKGVFTVSESLSQYSKKISDPVFIRVHRSAMVNAAAIASIKKKPNGTHAIQLNGGGSLIVARSRAALVPQLLRLTRSHSGATRG
ncbi:MAG: LytTR family DNA-binding domain-containing protein [Pseudomonadota bacterium]